MAGEFISILKGNFARKGALLAGLLGLGVLMGGCSRIDQGSVGIATSFTGHIDDQVAGTGWHSSLLTRYAVVDTTQTRVELDNMHPTDAHGVPVGQLSVVVTYSLRPSRVARFYKMTKELDHEPGSDYDTVGYEILAKSAVPAAVNAATAESNVQDLAADRPAYAREIQKKLEEFLDKHYGDSNPFMIDSVAFPVFLPPAPIQQQMEAKASAQAKLATLKAQFKTIQASQVNATAQAEVDANALAAAVKASGLTPEQVIAWKRAQALNALAQGGKNTTVLVSAKH